MKHRIHPAYRKNSEALQHIIRDFTDGGRLFGKAERNIIKLFDLDGITVNVKSFKKPGLLNKIVYKYFRKSKARRSYEYANILMDKNIGTPRPIGYFERSSPLGLKDSYYMSEHLASDLTYRELVTYPDYENHEEILRQFTKFTWQMHENGIYFKDHSPGNTLIVKNGKDYRFYLVDLNRMSFFEADFEARMKNFSRLTPKKEMVKIMSDEYAKLIGKDVKTVYEKMWLYTERFQEKFHRKKRFKQQFLGKKYDQ